MPKYSFGEPINNHLRIVLEIQCPNFSSGLKIISSFSCFLEIPMTTSNCDWFVKKNHKLSNWTVSLFQTYSWGILVTYKYQCRLFLRYFLWEILLALSFLYKKFEKKTVCCYHPFSACSVIECTPHSFLDIFPTKAFQFQFQV